MQISDHGNCEEMRDENGEMLTNHTTYDVFCFVYANGVKEIIGNLHLAQGKYGLAEQDFNNINSNSAALAQILNKNYNGAANTLKNVKNADGMTDYLKAIIAARTGKTSDAAIALQSALAKDASLRPYADKDLELKK